MQFTQRNILLYTFFKLPSAFWCGVRVESLGDWSCTTTVKHRWINQNPFQSMYFAVQAMAAEMSTGVLLMKKIHASGQPVSMLVANNRSSFGKKARGRIRFRCDQGAEFEQALQQALAQDEGVTVWVSSIGTDEAGDEVSRFDFEWTLRRKKPA